MTETTPAFLDSTLHEVLGHLTQARTAISDTHPLTEHLEEVALTLHEVVDLEAPEITIDTTTSPEEALRGAERALDAIPAQDRPLWLLPLRAELAILRRRSTA